MAFDIFKIKHIHLAQLVQYVLFNYNNSAQGTSIVTSYANNNICLGIVKDKQFELCQQQYIPKSNEGIHAYISGMYLEPHQFKIPETFDEICIDFTPLGYYHFIKRPLTTYVWDTDLLREIWGINAVSYFESVFAQEDIQLRGEMVEHFLLTKYQDFQDSFLKQSLWYLHTYPMSSLKQMAGNLQCSEKKIIRRFQQYFDLSPTDYARIIRFRKALRYMNKKNAEKLVSIAHRCNYYDQSHFIREVKYFTGNTPRNLYKQLYDIKSEVIVSVQ